MAEVPCWRGCGRPAEPWSLSCAPCRAGGRAKHDEIQGRQQLAHARDVQKANEAARGSRYVPCARCGRQNAVLARWARIQEQESERKTTERRLAMTHEGSGPFQRSIALTSPAGNFDPDDCCSECTRAKYSTFYD